MRVSSLNHLHGLIDQTALGIEPLLQSHCTNKAKNKLCDFISTFWHYDIITKKSQKARMWMQKSNMQRLKQTKRSIRLRSCAGSSRYLAVGITHGEKEETAPIGTCQWADWLPSASRKQKKPMVTDVSSYGCYKNMALLSTTRRCFGWCASMACSRSFAALVRCINGNNEWTSMRIS